LNSTAFLRRGVGVLGGGAIVLAYLASAGCSRLTGQGPLVVAFDDVPAVLDPHLQNNAVTWSLLGNFYDALVRFSPEMQLEPSLATSWRQLDVSHWRLTLREGVRFANGDAFSADDVIASFERARTHPRSLVRHYLLGVRAMRREDSHSVVVETDGAAPDLLNRLAFLFIVPRSAAGTDEIARPVGTGPYRFVRRESDGSVVAEAWRSWRGIPEIGNVRFIFFENDARAVQRFLAGHVDLLHWLPDDVVAEVGRRPGLRAEPQPRLAVQLLVINSHAVAGRAGEALADRRVRRALLLALNRAAWCGKIFRGNATVATQYVHPVVFGYDPTIAALPYDPDAARRLLAEAGFPDGFSAILYHAFLQSGVIEAIVDDWKRIGVRVEPQAAPFAELLAEGRRGELGIFSYAWACSTGDASDFLNSSLHSRDESRGLGLENDSGYADRETDALLDAAEVELDPAKRLALLQRAQRRVLEDLPVLPLTIRWGYDGVSSRLDIVTRHDDRVWVAAYHWRR
jgi:peptide/nickel transport system substrate-binding protein